MEDPITFEFNPFVGTGPYKLHSYDQSGFWTDLGKAGGLGQEPDGDPLRRAKPKYIVFQYFANEGAKILAQLTHEADVVNLSSDGLKAAVGPVRHVPGLSAVLPLGGEQ